MASPAPRSVTPIIAALRNFMNGRNVKVASRYEQDQSPRSNITPKLPYGVSHNLATNYYYGRDGRRESMPPTEAYDHSTKAIESGTEEKAPSMKTPAPGLKVINWDM